VINSGQEGRHQIHRCRAGLSRFPQQVVSLQNKGLDGSIMVEPFATQAVDTGAGVRFASTEEVYPGDQISEVFFGENSRPSARTSPCAS